MFMETLTQWINDIMLWIGFGTLAGLTAKAILPGKDPGGTVATLLMGIGGTVIGAGLVGLFWAGKRISPLTPLGFAAATLGATVILVFHRVLVGRFFKEAGTGPATPIARRRRYTTVAVKE